MANTFTLIASTSIAGGSSSSNFGFSSIPNTYTDLKVVWSGRASGSNYFIVRFNGDSGTYSYQSNGIAGSGSSTFNDSWVTISYWGLYSKTGYTANAFSNHEMYIPSYAGNNYKSVIIDSAAENNATAAYSIANSGIWYSTSAITDISIIADPPSTWSGYTTAYLYGIKNS